MKRYSAEHFVRATPADVRHVLSKKKNKKYILACSGKTGSTHVKSYLDKHQLHLDFDDRSGGSTSQRDVFSTQIDGWNGPSQRSLTSDELASGVTIGVIRNPFEWLLSLFIYNNTPGLAFPAYPNLKVFGDINFEGFIKEWYRSGFGPRGGHTRPYEEQTVGKGDFQRHRTLMHWQVVNSDGKIYPDFMIRTEYLNEGLSVLMEASGLPHRASGKSNVSRHVTSQSIRENYTTEMIEMVSELHARELRAYGYTFDGPTDNYELIMPNGVEIEEFSTELKPDYPL